MEDFMLVRSCIFLGHIGAGKTAIVRKLGGLVDDSIEFERGNILTNTSIVSILEVPTHVNYVRNLITRAEEANIGVLVVSVDVGDLHEQVKTFQTMEYGFFIKALGLSKIIVVINKMDAIKWSQNRFDKLKNRLSMFFGPLGLGYKIGENVEFIPVSGLSNTNIKTKVAESTCSWWKGKCLLEALESSQVPLGYCRGRLRAAPRNNLGEDGFSVEHIAVKRYVEELASIDLSLDGDSTNEELWLKRVICIDTVRNAYSKVDEAVKGRFKQEVSRKSLMAFKTALQLKNPHTIRVFKILGDGYREEGNLESAIDCYRKCLEFCKSQKNMTFERVFHNLLVDTNLQLEESEKKPKKKKKKNRNKEGHQNGEIKTEEDKLLGKEKNAMGNTNGQQSDEIKTEEDKLLGKEENATGNTEGRQSDEHTNDEDESKLLAEVVAYASYRIGALVPDGIYKGVMFLGNNVLGLQKSFIPCSPLHLENFSRLVSFGLSDVNVLTIGEVVNANVGEDSLTLMVAESVKTVKYHFMCLFEEFLKSQNCDARGLQTRSEDDQFKAMIAWWKYIAADFFKIFWSVVKGLLFLYSKGFPCGNLCGDHIYVTEGTQGRILPSFDESKSFKDDLEELEKTMRGIIYQAHVFNVSKENRREYLPRELAHMLNFLNNHRSSRFPSNVVDHPYFWTSAKRVSFVRKLRNLQKAGVIRAGMFEADIDVMMRVNFGEDYRHWSDYLPDGVLKDTWSIGGDAEAESGDNANQAESGVDANQTESGTDANQAIPVTVAPYSNTFGIIRYFNAVYTQANEPQYHPPIRRKEHLGEVEVEEDLRALFEDIYICLWNRLFILAKSNTFSYLSTEEVMKKLLSRSPC